MTQDERKGLILCLKIEFSDGLRGGEYRQDNSITAQAEDSSNYKFGFTREQFICSLDLPEDQEIIKIAVLNHNQTFIDNNLTEEELLFSQIIRDADKLDIFYIWKDMEFDKVEGKIDDKIYNRMLTCKYDYENINNKLDYYVLLIGFVYDINFSWTIRYLKENKYFNTIIDKVIEKNPHESLRLNKIKETINQYIESRDA